MITVNKTIIISNITIKTKQNKKSERLLYTSNLVVFTNMFLGDVEHFTGSFVLAKVIHKLSFRIHQVTDDGVVHLEMTRGTIKW